MIRTIMELMQDRMVGLKRARLDRLRAMDFAGEPPRYTDLVFSLIKGITVPWLEAKPAPRVCSIPAELRGAVHAYICIIYAPLQVV